MSWLRGWSCWGRRMLRRHCWGPNGSGFWCGNSFWMLLLGCGFWSLKYSEIIWNIYCRLVTVGDSKIYKGPYTECFSEFCEVAWEDEIRNTSKPRFYEEQGDKRVKAVGCKTLWCQKRIEDDRSDAFGNLWAAQSSSAMVNRWFPVLVSWFSQQNQPMYIYIYIYI